MVRPDHLPLRLQYLANTILLLQGLYTHLDLKWDQNCQREPVYKGIESSASLCIDIQSFLIFLQPSLAGHADTLASFFILKVMSTFIYRKVAVSCMTSTFLLIWVSFGSYDSMKPACPASGLIQFKQLWLVDTAFNPRAPGSPQAFITPFNSVYKKKGAG